MERLGLNKGRYHGEGIAIADILRDFHRVALERGWRAEPFATIDQFELFGYQRGPANPARTVYIASGIHGDEPSGPVTLLRLLAEDRWPADTHFILSPCTNPTGFVNKSRENQQGIDLNRDYKHLLTAEIRAHDAWIKTLPRFNQSILLHEDWEASGFYLYELNFEGLPSPAERVIEAVREIGPIETAPVVDGFKCEDGIIRPNVKPADREQWAEAIYLVATKSPYSITLETPSDFPLEFRVAMHRRAIEALLAENS